jgi:hypothetical protein
MSKLPLARLARWKLLCSGALNHFVVEYGIGVHLKTQIPAPLHSRQILTLGAVLGTHGALLIEFAKVEQIVAAIAHIVGTSAALVGRWQPQPGDASFGQGRRLAAQPVPVLPFGGDVPVEPLLGWGLQVPEPAGSLHLTGEGTQAQSIDSRWAAPAVAGSLPD